MLGFILFEKSLKENLDSRIRTVSISTVETQNNATEERVNELERTQLVQNQEIESIEEKIEDRVNSDLQEHGTTGVRVRIREYIVKRGDSLWNISKRYCHDPYAWVGIYNANGNKIRNPDLIYPGQRIFIPVIIEDE